MWTGAAQGHMLLNKVVHNLYVPFDDDAVPGNIAVVTRFNPKDPSTANGADVHQALA